MFTEALNAPWLLIILYAILFASGAIQFITYRTATYGLLTKEQLAKGMLWFAIGFMLLGAGLALLGAAYLHDVWYC